MTIQLGATYTDKITKFKGVCTGVCHYLTGCSQALISPEGDKDSRWVDFQRLDRDDEAATVVLDNHATPGCDRPAPIR